MFKKQKEKIRKKREQRILKDATEVVQLREFGGSVCICVNNRPLMQFEGGKSCEEVVGMLHRIRTTWASYIALNEL